MYRLYYMAYRKTRENRSSRQGVGIKTYPSLPSLSIADQWTAIVNIFSAWLNFYAPRILDSLVLYTAWYLRFIQPSKTGSCNTNVIDAFEKEKTSAMT